MLTYARLQQLRSYQDSSFEFDPGVNIIVGPNASGKTTILEAIYVNLQGKSFKAADKELIQAEKDWCRIDIGTNQFSRTTKIQTSAGVLQKNHEIEKKVYKRLPITQTVPIVLFEPNDLLLLHGGPELRRQFLDILLDQTAPGYKETLRQYKRVLAQRNALLKRAAHSTISSDQFFVWNLRLSELGGKIATERNKLLNRLNTAVAQTYSNIADKPTDITLSYQTKIPIESYETSLLKRLEAVHGRDIQIGFTTNGPHRDDVGVTLRGSDAHTTASRGEIRTLVLVLKMLAATFIEDALNKKPILLLDDVFSELDGKRRQQLVLFLQPYQSLITTTDADVVIDHFTETTHVISTQ